METNFFCSQMVVMGYDLCPHVTLKEQAAQVERGLATFLDARDTQRPLSDVFVGGISAGAHLAAHLLSVLPHNSRIAGYILLGGLYDLTPLPPLPPSAGLGLTEADAKALSPLLSTELSGEAKIFISAASDDSPAFVRQKVAFAQSLRAAGRVVCERMEEGLDHLHLSEHMAQDSALRRAVINFIKA